jgi:hypothetical protein
MSKLPHLKALIFSVPAVLRAVRAALAWSRFIVRAAVT